MPDNFKRWYNKKRTTDRQSEPQLAKLNKHNTLDIMLNFLNIKDDLEENEEVGRNKIPDNKCPEINIKLNNVAVTALIDSGSQLNGISETWFANNEAKLGKIDVLNLSNTNVKGALGNKSKLIKKQVLLTVSVQNYQFDLIFFIIPSLTKDCILGINMLKEGACIIDFKQQSMLINNPQYKNNECQISDHNSIQLQQISLEDQKEEEEDINFQEAVGTIETINEEDKKKVN